MPVDGAGSGGSLLALLERASALAGRARRPILASRVDRVGPLDPIGVFAAARALGLEPTLCLQPSAGVALVAIGSAWRIEPMGADRFGQVEAAWRLLTDGRVIEDGRTGDGPIGDGVAAQRVGPLLVGGFAFAAVGETEEREARWCAFGDGSLVVPELLLTLDNAEASLTTTVLVDEGLDPRAAAERQTAAWRSVEASSNALADTAGGQPPTLRFLSGESRAHWESSVAHLVTEIRRGDADKVVLARRVDAQADEPLDPAAVLRRLAVSSPDTTIFAVVRGQSCFLGATPERLVTVRGYDAETVALAGSAPRGADPTEDHLLGRALLASVKDGDEQAFVVRELRSRLEPLAVSIAIDSDPRLRRLEHVQHLSSEIKARLREHVGILSLVERLHPTPAVGGVPRDAALDLIARHETFDRGWYAGPIGWLDPNGDGEFVVGIRSGLVDGSDVSLYAGCGITADSEPEREYDETRLKLRTLANALGGLQP